MAIKRVWHGWTSREDADTYESLLRTEIFPEIAAKRIPGYRSIELLRCEHDDEVEFVTIMTFDSLKDVVGFQGDDYTRSYVPESARRVLKRWDARASHFEVRERKTYE